MVNSLRKSQFNMRGVLAGLTAILATLSYTPDDANAFVDPDNPENIFKEISFSDLGGQPDEAAIRLGGEGAACYSVQLLQSVGAYSIYQEFIDTTRGIANVFDIRLGFPGYGSVGLGDWSQDLSNKIDTFANKQQNRHSNYVRPAAQGAAWAENQKRRFQNFLQVHCRSENTFLTGNSGSIFGGPVLAVHKKLLSAGKIKSGKPDRLPFSTTIALAKGVNGESIMIVPGYNKEGAVVITDRAHQALILEQSLGYFCDTMAKLGDNITNYFTRALTTARFETPNQLPPICHANSITFDR